MTRNRRAILGIILLFTLLTLGYAQLGIDARDLCRK